MDTTDDIELPDIKHRDARQMGRNVDIYIGGEIYTENAMGPVPSHSTTEVAVVHKGQSMTMSCDSAKSLGLIV